MSVAKTSSQMQVVPQPGRTAPVRHVNATELETKRKQNLFAFEKSKDQRKTWSGGTSRRPVSAADQDRDTLVQRLGLTKESEDQLRHAIDSDPELDRLLLRWANDLPLNVLWYEAALARKRMLQKVAVAIVLALAVGTIAAVTWLAMREGQDGVAKGVSAQITFVASALFLALQVIARAIDLRAQIGAFWEAAANLKEAVYRLEEEWTDHVWDVPEVIRFKTALKENLRLARDETHKERATFFRTLQSPAEVVDSATSALATLEGKRDAFAKARDAVLAAQRAELAAHEAAASLEMQRAVQLRADVEVRARELESARGELSSLAYVHEKERSARVAKPEVTDKMLTEARTKVAQAEEALARVRDELLKHLGRKP